MNTVIPLSIRKSGRPVLLALALIVLSTLPLYTPVYTRILLTSIFMYVVITVSWAVFSGPTGYISLAPAAFFGIGIYTSAVLGPLAALPVVIGTAGAASFCFALLAGALTLRLRGICFAIFTFGLVELIKHLLLWWEINFTGTRGRFVVVVDPTTVYYYMLAVLVILMLAACFIDRSKYGLALRSIGAHEEAAAHTGINVTCLKTNAFAFSAFFIGAAGALMATRWTYIDPGIAFNPLFSFMPVLMATFGGTERLYGPVLGAVIFAYLEEVLITRFPYFYMLIFGAVLVLVIIFLPSGLIGWMGNRLKGRRHAHP